MRALMLLGAIALTLCGCASLVYDPYKVTLVKRETGAAGTGTAPRDWTPGGRIAVQLDGKAYEGPWFHIPSDEAVLVERWGEPTLWPDPVADEEMIGTAETLLIAGDKDKLRCQLRFNLRAHRGKGTCKALTGGFYNLRFEPD